MLNFFKGRLRSPEARILDAFNHSQALIEFDLDGNILTANENFLKLLEYKIEEVRGRHHRIFVSSEYAASEAYQKFWTSLRQGIFQQANYVHLGKDGREVWLQASYNPVFKRAGKPVKIVAIATDITEQKQQAADYIGQISAIGRAQAVIEFSLDGKILTANDNFLKIFGYPLAEIQGQHHALLVDPSVAKSSDYQAFWAKLREGQFLAAEYKRLAKGGRAVWILATYNPIFDAQGRPFKVVKYATDVTEQVLRRQRAEAVGSQIDSNLAQIVRAIGDITEQTSRVAGAATQTSAGVQTVAASAEELAASIAEVSSNVVRSKTSADTAMEHVAQAGETAGRLATAAEAMSSVIKFIQDIAANINLLALNATIEAARAGDAGKGFAVVASEVKNLAQQVAQATENISREIAGVQEISTGVSDTLSRIGSAMAEVQSRVTGVAGAIEEQTAVTRDISANMQGTSGAVSDIEGNIHHILESVEGAQRLSNESLRLYAELQR